MSYRFKAVFIISLLSASLSAMADINTSGYQLSAYAGATRSTIDSSATHAQYTIVSPSTPYNQRTDFSWGAGLAYRFLIPPTQKSTQLLHDISLGWDIYTFQTGQDGPTWLNQPAALNQYAYNTTITSLRYIVDSEWTFKPIFHRLFPFIEGGLGFSYNRLAYTPDTDDGYTLINKASQYAFAYTAGAGLKFSINPKLQVSLRYLYTHLGNASLNQVANIPLTTPISMSLYTQSGLLGLSYLL
jgi:hypothetical protein